MIESRLKNFKISFLWLAAGILLAHSIIPHHHHYGLEGYHQICGIEEVNHTCKDQREGLLSFHHETGEKEHCDECHFKTDIPDQKIKNSLHQLYLVPNDNFTLVATSPENHFSTFYNILYSPNYLKRQSDRAPPFKT